jgi:hypothetical protein
MRNVVFDVMERVDPNVGGLNALYRFKGSYTAEDLKTVYGVSQEDIDHMIESFRVVHLLHHNVEINVRGLDPGVTWGKI